MADDPGAVIAVIARSPSTARRIADDMRGEVPLRLVWGGDFSFAPGVEVTTVDQVRGLEFDHVIVPDASASAYGADPASRQALYVAITRARKSARLASVGPPAAAFVNPSRSP